MGHYTNVVDDGQHWPPTASVMVAISLLRLTSRTTVETLTTLTIILCTSMVALMNLKTWTPPATFHACRGHHTSPFAVRRVPMATLRRIELRGRTTKSER